MQDIQYTVTQYTKYIHMSHINKQILTYIDISCGQGPKHDSETSVAEQDWCTSSWFPRFVCIAAAWQGLQNHAGDFVVFLRASCNG